MPELPEVETVKRGLEPVLIGHKILKVETRRAGLRFAFPPGFAARLAGTSVKHLSRRAKYIIADLGSGLSLLVHLGMTGRFSVLSPNTHKNPAACYFATGAGQGAYGPHDHVVFHLENASQLVYCDPRRFGLMDLVETAALGQHKLLKSLGVEPLSAALSAIYLVQKFKGKNTSLKTALLDQRIIAGLGNIYVCEALFRARISPERKAGHVSAENLATLVRHIRAILNDAILAGGSTLQDFQHTNGARGSYQQQFLVYDREGEACHNCGHAIKRLTQAGRSSFYCPACQK